MSKKSVLKPKSAHLPQKSNAPKKRNVSRVVPIVAIGASAGGLKAFTALFSDLPENTGMAYVVVQHLAGDYESILTSLLAKCTRMPVVEVKQNMLINPNHVYVISPHSALTVENGTLHRVSYVGDAAHRGVIDRFFYSLAEEKEVQKIGVILSGTGSDGTGGLQSIKAAGGFTFAQEPSSAEYNSMPTNAIATGDVDFVLTPSRIAQKLAKINTAGNRKIARTSTSPSTAMDAIRTLLHNTSGIDFTHYKIGTLQRRIAHRMGQHNIRTLPKYLTYLKKDPTELNLLKQDILITVTSFFRDSDAFLSLKKALHRLLKKRGNDPVRVWVAGCATGEEVYSVAIILMELFEEKNKVGQWQIFGTDINEVALEKGRKGVYAEPLEMVSLARRKRYFTKTKEGWQVNKMIRERCIFAKHDVTQDPPFSNIDLVVCRNVLIYMDADLQKKAIYFFHYAIKAHGLLFLGRSESMTPFSDLFSPIDKKNQLYIKKKPDHRVQYLFSTRLPKLAANTPRLVDSVVSLDNTVDRIIMGKYSPAAVIINNRLEIVQFRGDTSPYIEHSAGAANLQVLKMTRTALRPVLHSLVNNAIAGRHPTRKEGVLFTYQHRRRIVNLEVTSVNLPEQHFVIFFEKDVMPKLSEPAKNSRKSGDYRFLQQELESTRQYLQTTIEAHEKINSELEITGEESLSKNEELQSLNEELQTAKEELQSTNEELMTVNEELQNSNQELNKLNIDLHNVLESSHLPIMILDKRLNIRRFTTIAAGLFNLTTHDVGQPMRTAIPSILDIVEEAIHSKVRKEKEWRDKNGRWHAVNVYLYKKNNRTINDIVVVFADIDLRKNYERYIIAGRDFAENIIKTIGQPLVILDEKFQVRKANESFYKVFKVAKGKTENCSFYKLEGGQWDIPAVRKLLEAVLDEGAPLRDLEVEITIPKSGKKFLCVTAARIKQASTEPPLILVALEDITLRKHAEAVLQDFEKRKDTFMSMASHELKTPLVSMKLLTQLLHKQFENAGDKRTTEILSRMNDEIDSFNRMVTELLDVAKIRAGKLRFYLEKFSLTALAQDVVALMQPVASKQQLLFKSSGDVEVFADKGRIKQVFINLLSNAIKYSSKEKTIQIGLTEGKEYVTVSVQNHGEGIAEEQQKKIFEQFYQSKDQHSHGDLGMGLYISSEIIKNHGGKLWVESREGQGATFFFTVPLKKPNALKKPKR